MGKILVIEDEEALRHTILDLLEMENHQAVAAENGLSGLSLTRKEQPDLVICDVMMPELDGYDVLKSLRADVATAKLPFLLLSAKATKADLGYGLSLGATAYLTKPFTLTELLEVINSCLAYNATSSNQ